MYEWAQNKLKLQRAIKKAADLSDESEEKVKEIYISLAGKVINKIGRPKNDKNPAVDTKE